MDRSYKTGIPKKVAINIRAIKTKIFKFKTETKSPAVKSKVSPGKAKNMPDSRKTIIKIPRYP